MISVHVCMHAWCMCVYILCMYVCSYACVHVHICSGANQDAESEEPNAEEPVNAEDESMADVPKDVDDVPKDAEEERRSRSRRKRKMPKRSSLRSQTKNRKKSKHVNRNKKM